MYFVQTLCDSPKNKKKGNAKYPFFIIQLFLIKKYEIYRILDKICTMKKIFSLVLLFSTHCFSQTIIEGVLPSLKNNSFSVKADVSALNDHKGLTIGKGTIDENGQFRSAISLSKEQPVTLFTGNVFFVLWIKPNSTLSIRESENKNYIFSGAASAENFLLYTTGIMQPFAVPGNIGTTDFRPEMQLKYIDSIETGRLSLKKNAERSSNLSKIFLDYYKAEVTNFSLFNKNQYPAFFKTSKKITEDDIPGTYFGFWDKFILPGDSNASRSYQNALGDFIEYKALQNTGSSEQGTEKSWEEMFRTADSLLVLHPLSLQKQKTSFLLLLIKYFNFPYLTGRELDNYKRQFPSSASIALLEDMWKKKQASLSIIPSFRLKNEKGDWVKIENFRGSVVYIDFWGSWCKACLENMPHAKTLKERFKNEKVAFLYLDFNDTKEKWTEAIKKYKIEGVHLKAETSDEEYFIRVFNTGEGFPRYALIDKEGKLVTISAPPPQHPDIYPLIKKHLDE